MISKLVENTKSVRTEVYNFLEGGGNLFIDRKLNFNISKSAPKKGKSLFSVHVKGKKQREKEKQNAIQNKLKAAGVASIEDVKRLERAIRQLKKQLSEYELI